MADDGCDAWIEGRFEGTYSGERRRGAAAGPAGRRFSFELISGEVEDLAKALPPEPQLHETGRPVIRQARIRDVVLHDAQDTGEDGEPRVQTLFDVHIHDWELRYPAEVGARSFGTIVGRIHARLRPPQVELEATALDERAADAPATMPPTLQPAPQPRRAAGGLVRSHAVEGLDPNIVWRRLRWTLALLFMALAAIGIGLHCGRETAALYAAPLLAAFALRALTRPLAERGPRIQHWLGLALVGSQAALLWHAVSGVGSGECLPVLAAPLLWLTAAPVLLGAWAQIRWPLALTSIGWTAAVCIHCGALASACAVSDTDTSSAAASLSAPLSAPISESASAPLPGSRPASRTDAAGRWPAPPGNMLSGDGPARDGAADSARPLGDWLRTLGTGLLDSIGSAFSGTALSGTPLSGPPGDASSLQPRSTSPEVPSPGASDVGSTSVLEVRGEPQTAVSFGSDAADSSQDVRIEIESGPVHTPTVGPASAPASPAASRRSRSRAAGSEVPGGWLAPDHRRADRALTLISIEQANRTPGDFYDSDGARRVYLPTDAIFDAGGSRLQPAAGLSLTRLAALLALHREQGVVVELHTDAGGGATAQQALSERRAAAVRAWLIDRGHIDAGRFDVVALGARHPLVPPDGSFAAQRPNRRIEVRLIE